MTPSAGWASQRDRTPTASALSSSRCLAWLGYWFIALGGGACKREAPPAAPPPAPERARFEVSSGANLLYTYADESGAFQTVDRIEAVPAPLRRFVRVVDPERPPDERNDTDHVYVVDLTELERRSPVQAELMPRALYETRALAQLTPGASSALADAPRSALADGATPDGGAPLGPGTSVTAQVVLYGTSWCGACRQARQYFVKRGIPFLDKDIEKDEAAAAELRAKAARAGIAADRVPVLDVAGRLLIGFDPVRIERILETTGTLPNSGTNPI